MVKMMMMIVRWSNPANDGDADGGASVGSLGVGGGGGLPLPLLLLLLSMLLRLPRQPLPVFAVCRSKAAKITEASSPCLSGPV